MRPGQIFRTVPGRQLLLASASPRRKALLASLGLDFAIAVSRAPERAAVPGEAPALYAARMAADKYGAVAAERGRAKFTIIAADTVVRVDNFILGKPRDSQTARRMLSLLNGRSHEVYTAVHIGAPGEKSMTFCEMSRVCFADWPDAVLAACLAASEPLDKAGAYGIQDEGMFLARRIEGSYTNIMGLPVAQLAKVLLENGIIEAVSAKNF